MKNDEILAFCVEVLAEAGIVSVSKDKITFKKSDDHIDTVISFPSAAGLTRADLHTLLVLLIKH